MNANSVTELLRMRRLNSIGAGTLAPPAGAEGFAQAQPLAEVAQWIVVGSTERGLAVAHEIECSHAAASCRPQPACPDARVTAGPDPTAQTARVAMPPTADTPAPAAVAATPLIDSDHPAVLAFARRHAQGQDDRERAVALYYAVRDGFRYDPYRIDLSPHGMRASTVLEAGFGWCVTKAALLAAACRALGIPARLGYADVRNHLSTERMRKLMKTDVFVWHGYTEMWIEGAWRKSTPAFNLSLCERFGLHPLEWDGLGDSLYHEYDRAGNRHMEYVNQRGSFDDMPLAQIVADFATFYPGIYGRAMELDRADFMADVAREAPPAT